MCTVEGAAQTNLSAVLPFWIRKKFNTYFINKNKKSKVIFAYLSESSKVSSK